MNIITRTYARRDGVDAEITADAQWIDEINQILTGQKPYSSGHSVPVGTRYAKRHGGGLLTGTIGARWDDRAPVYAGPYGGTSGELVTSVVTAEKIAAAIAWVRGE